jgi:hypothetical protein
MHPQSFGDFQYRNQCCILSTAFNHAYIGAVDTHPVSDSCLTEIGGNAVTAHIGAKDFANIHPQLRNQSRILMRRIIIPEREALQCVKSSYVCR